MTIVDSQFSLVQIVKGRAQGGIGIRRARFPMNRVIGVVPIAQQRQHLAGLARGRCTVNGLAALQPLPAGAGNLLLRFVQLKIVVGVGVTSQDLMDMMALGRDFNTDQPPFGQ